MKIIDYTELKQFINSDATEIEFYGLNKEGLVSLKEYLNMLSEAKKRFFKEINSPLNSIQSKMPEVIDIKPEFDNHSALKVICQRPNTDITIAKDYNEWYATNARKVDQLSFMIRKKYQMKLDQIERGIINDELNEILDLYEEIFKDKINKETASERFNIATKSNDNIIESAVYAPITILDKKIVTRAPLTYVDDNNSILIQEPKAKDLDSIFVSKYVDHEHLATKNYNADYVKELSVGEKEKLKNKIYIKM